MAVCEKCWADAHKRVLPMPYKSVNEHYQDLMREREGSPCSKEEQGGIQMTDSNEVKHTPTPWEIGEVIDGAEEYNECANVRGVVIRGPRKAIACQDDAEFIIRTVNSHEEMKSRISTLEESLNECRGSLEMHQAGLKKLEEENKQLIDGIYATKTIKELEEENRELREQNEALLGFLKQYGRHEKRCHTRLQIGSFNKLCVCGLDDALAESKTQEEK